MDEEAVLTRLTRPKHDAFGPRKRKAFLDVYSQTANISFACKKAGISRQTYYDTLARDPEFAAQVADAGEEAIDSLEGVAWHKAKVERDNTSLWNLLKAHRPEKYVPVQKVAETNAAGDDKEITDADRARRILELLTAVGLEEVGRDTAQSE